MCLTSQHQHEVAHTESTKDDDPQDHDGPQHGALILGALLPKVNQDDANAVKCVIHDGADQAGLTDGHVPVLVRTDRKSTRLNSSHVAISYAVFCLKKKKLTEYSL